MGKFIPNERSKVLFLVGHENKNEIKVADLTTAVNLTPFIMSLNASTQGNTVPTPSIDTLFETSIPGTVQASFSMDCYRDDDPAKDLAWKTLPRGTKGMVVISRIGPANGTTLAANDEIEVWPVWIVSRTMSNMSSNTAASFTVNSSVPEEPVESLKITA